MRLKIPKNFPDQHQTGEQFTTGKNAFAAQGGAFMKRKITSLTALLCVLLLLGVTGCATAPEPSQSQTTEPALSSSAVSSQASDSQTGLIAEQIFNGAEGAIHYSYYLPEGYSENREYPLMMVMPGYDMMWFGEDSSGANLNWRGFTCWTELSEDMIVVSAQLTDWGATSARQAIELTEYFLENFSVDPNRVYAAGYSAGGETMSQAVSMRPDLYAAYLHGASQWDGEYAPIAENGVAVYIFMAEGDEYYGSQRARDAFFGLHNAYRNAGWSEEQINQVLQMQIPDADYFAQRGITGNYHGGANIMFEDDAVLNWILPHSK